MCYLYFYGGGGGGGVLSRKLEEAVIVSLVDKVRARK